MLSEKQRGQIVTEAVSWLGTPYKGWARLKGKRGGADCGQFLYGVFLGCGLMPEIADLPKDYSLQVAKHRASRDYRDLVERFFREIPEAEARPGDLVLYKIGLAFAHGAVIVEWPNFIIQAEERHGVSGAHGSKSPLFRHTERLFYTLKDEYCGGTE